MESGGCAVKTYFDAREILSKNIRFVHTARQHDVNFDTWRNRC